MFYGNDFFFDVNANAVPYVLCLDKSWLLTVFTFSDQSSNILNFSMTYFVNFYFIYMHLPYLTLFIQEFCYPISQINMEFCVLPFSATSSECFYIVKFCCDNIVLWIMMSNLPVFQLIIL